jgi:hypothetical protein
MAEITLSNGSRIRTFLPPPSGFDPLKATASQLAVHGFPPWPEDPALKDRFRHHFARVQGRMNIIVPTFSVRPSMRNHSAGGPEGVAGQTIWSGAVVYAGTGQSCSVLKS